MSLLLHIDTSDQLCSAALSENDSVIAQHISGTGRSHASQLTVIIEELLKEAGLEARNLSAVAVSKGPGSYTGLRIGVSVAKGMCYALDIPLIAVNTLLAMTAGFINKKPLAFPENTLFCPMIDARRMEVYNALFDHTFNEVLPVSAAIIDQTSFHEILNSRPVVFFGSGAGKCKTTIVHQNALFADEFFCEASFLAHHAFISFQNKQFEDVAYFEPYYLKDFVAIKSTKDVLNSRSHKT